MRKEKKTKLILFVIPTIFVFLSFYFLFFNLNSNHVQKKKIIKLKVSNLNEIQQNSDHLSKPGKLVPYKGKIYIFEQNTQKIMVFNENGYLYSLSDPLTDLQKIPYSISFDIINDEIYLLDHSNGIVVMNIQGEYLRFIHLEKKDLNSIPTDLKIHGNYIYVAFEFSNIEIARYDLNGKYVDDFIKNDSSIDDFQNLIISGPSTLFISPDYKILVLFNRFSGKLRTYNIYTGRLLNTFKDFDPEIKKIIKLAKTNINSKKFKTIYQGSKKSIEFWRSAIDYLNHRIILIPSQSSIQREKRKSLLYVYDFKTNTIKQMYIQINNVDFTIRDCCFDLDRIIFMDYNFDLYIGGIV